MILIMTKTTIHSRFDVVSDDGDVELLKQAHTAQLAQQAGAADRIRYLTVDAGKTNIQFKSLNTRQTELMRLERIASAIGI